MSRPAAPTPIREQYLALKAQHPDALLLFHLGDFYETFDDDARIVARVCNVALTAKELGKGQRFPLAGVPVRAVHVYLRRLLNAGYRVAIADQVESPAQKARRSGGLLPAASKGLIERTVVRVVTPGTLAEPALLSPRENSYLAAVAPGPDGLGLAVVDVTTGEGWVSQFAAHEAETLLAAELRRLAPGECLIPEGAEALVAGLALATPCDPSRFAPGPARARLCARLGVANLEAFGCEGLPLAIGAAGALFAFVESTSPRLLDSVGGLRTERPDGYLQLDPYSRRNLELERGARTGAATSGLLPVIDRAQTSMGGRLLRRWLRQPLAERAPLAERHAAVAELVAARRARKQLADGLKKLPDLERLAARILQRTVEPNELRGLAVALRALPAIQRVLGQPQAALLAEAAGKLTALPQVADLVERALGADGLGRRIRPGYSAELDALAASVQGDHAWIAALEAEERQRTGIRSLKVGFNRVFGYYLEVSKANGHLVPQEWERRQTLTQAERYVTPALREREAALARAEGRIEALEDELYEALVREIGRDAPRLRATAEALALIDVCVGLAELAADEGWVRPELSDEPLLELDDSRHPVVERMAGRDRFIPNDCRLDTEGAWLLLLTGPNMSGKSTYLRQVALCVLLAQMGSFVPARRARIGLVDRIFTRVGAHDDIAAGASTFLVEMSETAHLLRHASPRSLVLLDEIGRGTSTYDGLALAQAVLEHLHNQIGCRTLFATHYHELTALAARLPGVRNLTVAVAEQGDQVVFLHRVVPGQAQRSYGVQVARLAGMPAEVLERARAILAALEQDAVQAVRETNGQDSFPPLSPAQQLPLNGFRREPGQRALAELLALDLDQLTPIEALNQLQRLQALGRGARL